MKRDLVDFLLAEFRSKPGMYLGDYSLSKLPALTVGFMVACNFYDETKTGMDRFSEFYNWFEKRHSLQPTSTWTHHFLEMVNHDERRALDMFFSELETFVSENRR